jgi:tetratricopeptide (TPR) repeat protein
MKKIFLILMIGMIAFTAGSQTANSHARAGNILYRQGKFDKALPEYQKSVANAKPDPVLSYNLGNAYYKNSKFSEAEKVFDVPAAPNNTTALREKAVYNKGVALTRQNKLEESIAAYKQALMLDPSDEDARVNLQKALMELKKRQPPEQKENKKKKEQKKDQQKQPPKSKLTQKKVEQYLKALEQKEQQVQQKMQQNRNRTSGNQEKDW